VEVAEHLEREREMERMLGINVWHGARRRSHPTGNQSWWWRDLVKVCRKGGGDGWFKKEVGWKLGKGDKARFWEDVWTGNVSLKTLYPRLFSLSLNKGQKVGEVGPWKDSEWQWKLSWRRDRFEWEIPFETEIGMLISRVKVIKDEQDKQVWRGDESGSFTVKSAYECLEEPERGTPISSFGCLWKIKAFPNVMTTVWRVLLNRVPTRECLSKRGAMVNTIECAFCHSKEESCQHLFLECKHAVRVWDLCFRWVGIWSVQHNNIMINFESFYLIQHTHKQNLVWKGVWAAIVRCLWEHRNLIIFNQRVVDAEEVFHNAQLKSWLWLKHKESNFDYSYADWILNPLSCISSIK